MTPKVKDAKTQNEQWSKNPDQMLMYSASRMWGRRYCPDILLGIVFDDEEIPGVTVPAMNGPRTAIASPPTQSKAKGDIIDQLTGEVFEGPVALTKDQNEKPYDWGVRLVAALRTSPDIDTADQWLAANSDTLAEIQTSAPKVYGNLTKAIEAFKLELLNQGEGT